MFDEALAEFILVVQQFAICFGGMGVGFWTHPYKNFYSKNWKLFLFT